MGLCQVRHNGGGQAQEICSDLPAPLGTLVPCHTNCKELIAYAALLAEQKDAASCHPSQHCPCLSLALLPFLPRSQDCPFTLVLPASHRDCGHKGQQPSTVLPSWGWSVAMVGQCGKRAAWKGSRGVGGHWGWSCPPL